MIFPGLSFLLSRRIKTAARLNSSRLNPEQLLFSTTEPSEFIYWPLENSVKMLSEKIFIRKAVDLRSNPEQQVFTGGSMSKPGINIADKIRIILFFFMTVIKAGKMRRK